MDIDQALDFLERRPNYESKALNADSGRTPSLELVAHAMDLLGDPQYQYPVIHITGTNGKTSTTRMTTSLLVASGLSVGTITSPHLEVVNERIRWNGKSIDDGNLARAIDAIAALDAMFEGDILSYFEVCTAAAYWLFADLAVDVVVSEVGMGGRWDSTNVADGDVAVVTNVGLDHQEFLGDTREAIATEKSGIVKEKSHLILGETDPKIQKFFLDRPHGATWFRGDDFDCDSNQVAHGGRLLSLRTPHGRHDDVFLPLHGRYQGDNAATAIAAVEAFFGRTLDDTVAAEGFGNTRSPGRMEIVHRDPTCILDGAHNVDGIRALTDTLKEEFAATKSFTLVFGVLGTHDPHEMLKVFGKEKVRRVLVCAPDTRRALSVEKVAEAARSLGIDVKVVPIVSEAVKLAINEAEEDEIVVVTGSLYVVGEARRALGADPA